MAVADTGLAWAFSFLSIAVLFNAAYRGLVRHEAAWDLLALVFISFGIALVYQLREKALVRGWLKKALLIALVWGILGAIFGMVLSILRST